MTQLRRQSARQRKRRQLKIRRAIVLIVLALIIVLIAAAVVRCTARRAQEEKKKQAAKEPKTFSVTLRFAGDINLADDYYPMQHYQEIKAKSVKDVIDPEYVDLMKDADIMWVNNEFCYSDRGTPYPGKEFTFRADPKNVSLLKEMGVDVAGLANNHVFDFQEEAFTDTLKILKDTGIPYVGAGKDLAEASSPVYVKAGPLTVAFVAAERAEKSLLATQEATEDQPGVLRCYDNAQFVAAIKEAAKQANYVVALPHWGTEHSTVLEDAQTEGAKEYVEAGADAVVGGHPHVLQGLDFYEGKPIVYSLGNFWFDNYDLMTMIAELRVTGKYVEEKDDADKKTKDGGKKDEKPRIKISDIKTELVIYPGKQTDMQTRPAADASERDEILRHLEDISDGITIDKKGVVTLSE